MDWSEEPTHILAVNSCNRSDVTTQSRMRGSISLKLGYLMVCKAVYNTSTLTLLK